MLKKTEPYGMEGLCVTKLPPATIKERYGIEKAFILWVSFEKAKSAVSPRDIAGLIKKVNALSMRPDLNIVLLDCLDQIKFAAGFEKSLDPLNNLRSLARTYNSILLISISPLVFEKEELKALGKEVEQDTP